ncbi:MAG: DUF1552 domain-containing protein [Planctomycetaceae bacterium]|jgi:hypothetical protein|nr:DUF1552 domain-containing protein [Planctomycetaceae bacterium]MBT6484093.1 DUF1552 domain-containing protein [Planctomycetaceae bacterium]MBT6496404.1 DUF1552 domain-containing protein [Planctomycetaceae bacterium]
MNPSDNVSRRVLLKGLGLSVALPWLEAAHLWGGETVTKPTKVPQRFACLFIGDGISPPLWWSKGDGAEMQLGASLKSLEPYKDKLNVINGLYNRNAGGGHARCTGNILSGVSLQRGRVIHGAVSMDQTLARHLEEESFLPSLVLGCEQPVSGFHETQYSMVYASHISWRNENSPIPIELYPSLAFDSLFGKQTGKLQGSILDQVLQQANDLRNQVSRSDQLKVDEYLTSVRETERRLQRLNKQSQEENESAVSASQRPPTGQPKDFREYTRLMCDIIALAFQTDRSRIATLLMSRDLSGQVYPFLNIRDDHHSYSHSNTGPEYQSIVNCHIEQYSYLIDRLSKMQEGESTVLDNSCIMFVSEHWNAHNSNQVPLVLAGGLGGTLQTGRSLDYMKSGDDKRKLCSLYLSLMDRMGLELPEFGDATERLAGI